MKVLIWILCFFVESLVVTLIQLDGIILGGVPILFFSSLTIWIAITLCRRWDEYKVSIKAEKNGVTSFVFIKGSVPSIVLKHCETIRCQEENLKSYLKQCAKDGMIERAYVDIICKEYMCLRKQESHAPTVKELSEGTDKILFCRNCGNKLLDGAKFCNKCGTEVTSVEE